MRWVLPSDPARTTASPLTSMVTDLGSLTSSTKVYFSSPNVCSYTNPAQPRISGVKSSTEFWAIPPQANCNLRRKRHNRSNHSPLHVSALGSPQGQDTILGQNIETERIYTLLVDDHKSFRLFTRPHCNVADGILKLDNLLQLCIDESSFRFDELFPLLGRRVEKARVDLPAVSARSCSGLTSFRTLATHSR